MAAMVRLPPPLERGLLRLAEVARPAECCGVVLVRADAVWVWPCANRARDPRRAYAIGAADRLAIAWARLVRGWRLWGIYHSHPEGGPVLSDADRVRALRRGRPVYPDAKQLVISLPARRVGVFAWSAQAHAFVPMDP